MLTKDDFIIRGFNCIHLTSRDIGGRACGGVSVMVRDGIPSSECTLNTSLQAKAVTISTSKIITICSLYLPPSENLNIVLLTLYKYQFGFRKSHSTSHAIISLVEKINNALDSEKILIGVFLDLKKSFRHSESQNSSR